MSPIATVAISRPVPSPRPLGRRPPPLSNLVLQRAETDQHRSTSAARGYIEVPSLTTKTAVDVAMDVGTDAACFDDIAQSRTACRTQLGRVQDAESWTMSDQDCTFVHDRCQCCQVLSDPILGPLEDAAHERKRVLIADEVIWSDLSPAQVERAQVP